MTSSRQEHESSPDGKARTPRSITKAGGQGKTLPSSQRRSVSLDIPFYRTRLPEKYPGLVLHLSGNARTAQSIFGKECRATGETLATLSGGWKFLPYHLCRGQLRPITYIV